ncbi:ankyrin and armadillo repeat-containing protein [Bombina bombina]|uniref:ankyrin and armadillo repeat-containing protein n=1 Tax=Bombina bombina TaxID=8345 RepID=UPI00235AFD89|nr:ankyrin and armadillo repeat-containing protein [Bombina bombina]
MSGFSVALSVLEPVLDEMEELDDNGWAPIHHGAYKNHVSLVERLLESSEPEELETVTADSLQNTPLLLAASSGSQEMVNLLVKHGANIAYVNRQNHGVVEICAIYRHIDLLEYFISLDNKDIDVYKRLVTLLDSDSKDDILISCSVIYNLTNQQVSVTQSHVENFANEKLISGMISVLRKNIEDEAKISALDVIKCLLENENVNKRHTLENNDVEVLISLVSQGSSQILTGLMETICELVSEKSFAEVHCVNIIPAFLKVFSNFENSDKEYILLPAFRAIGLMATNSSVAKEAIGKQSGLISSLVKLFKESQPKSVIIAWSDAIGRIAENHLSNQNLFVNENVGLHASEMLKLKQKDVQMSAAKTLYRGGLKKAPATCHGRTTRQTIPLLVEFIESASYKLNLIGARGLSVLVQGPYNLRNLVASANGAHHLVRLLRSHREDVVLSAIQAIGHICLGVGYIPHHRNQTAVANCRGLKFLIALLIHSQSEVIQVEAALAIAAAVLGHRNNVDMLCTNPAFHFEHMVSLLHSPSEEIRLMAGAALATFAFNNSSLQKEIVQSGGIRWYDIGPFLESANQNFRVDAAFQLVILARIIPDKEPSFTCATGIQTLMSILESTTNNETLAFAADCVARISHTRAGLLDAMISINVVRLLSQLLSHPSEQVQGSAAIALSYLSFNHMAERQLLKRCREDPHLMKTLLYYNKKQNLSSSFLARWKHIRELVLPPIRSMSVFRSTTTTSQKRRKSPVKHYLGCHFVALPSADFSAINQQ